MTSRPARHRRPDQSSQAVDRLRRLGAPVRPPVSTDGVGGWVPTRPVDPTSVAATSVAGPGRQVRVAPSARAVLGIGLVVLLAVLTAVLVVWQAQPAAQAAPRVRRLPAVASSAGSVAPAPAATSPPTEVLVHVVGAVRRPGLVALPPGSRVADAVRAAGGETAAALPASVNLARVVVDGEQVVVQRRGRPVVAAPGPAAAPAGSAGGSGPAAPVDLNTATLEALDGLPGIGPVLAQRILDWRTAHGRFSTVDELGEVSGIGEATLADLRPVVTV